MKFYCDHCGTKYEIADEKVRGKVVKVRCKSCEEIIVVRGKSGGDSGERGEEWYYSVDGETFGPMSGPELRQTYARGEVGADSHVWKAAFGDWKPVTEVEPFASIVRETSPSMERAGETLGVDGSVESIQSASKESTGAPDKRSDAASRSDRLKNLRSRLDANFGGRGGGAQGATAVESQPEPEPETDSEQRPISDLDLDLDDDAFAELEKAAEEVGPSDATRVEPSPAGAMEEADDEVEEEIPDIPAPEAAPPEDAQTAPPDEATNDGLFDGVDAASDQQTADDEEMPEAPSLSSDRSKSFGDTVTDSLLIQLDKIQNEGAGKRRAMLAAVLLVIAGLGGAWYYYWSTAEPKEDPMVAADDQGAYDDDDGLTFRTYSDDKSNPFGGESAKKIAPPSDKEDRFETALSNRGPSGNRGQGGGSKQGGGGPGAEGGGSADKQEGQQGGLFGDSDSPIGGGTSGDDNSFEEALKGSNKRTARANSPDESSNTGTALGGTESKGMVAESQAPKGGSLAPDDFDSVNAIESNRPDYRPNSDQFDDDDQGTYIPEALSKEQIRKGISTVQDSLATCRQRHSNRGAPLEAGKIFIVLTVEPTGEVSDFGLDPDRVSGTYFEECLRGHRARWDFGSYEGSTEKLRAPFILQ
jgi:predicted Zn finger-like uncharacterized protein